MPFIPHTEAEVQQMLSIIGAPNIDALFDEIPAELRYDKTANALAGVPEADSEMAITRRMHELATRNRKLTCFAGAGAYEHHIPAAVWEITTRGEFYSAYTPYQAEASQGTLQLLYEFQSMMVALTGMDVSNASLYDGASGLAEAVLMAVRGNRKSKSRKVLVAGTVNPVYLRVANAIVHNQNIELVSLPYCSGEGRTLLDALQPFADEDICALVVQQPNVFGALEPVDALTDWAAERNVMMIGVCNPTALALLKPPGDWGTVGADIVCGEGQPLGVPMSGGGPFFGYICCKQAHVRQMPGRIVGQTVDLDEKRGFALTLQAREQHIRRSKATSNICTNQGLMVTAATIYMSIVGGEGLRHVAQASAANTRALVDALTALEGVEQVFSAPYFHEVVLRLPKPVHAVLEALAERGILGGVALGADHPDLADCLLVCATETRTPEDIADYAAALQEVLA